MTWCPACSREVEKACRDDCPLNRKRGFIPTTVAIIKYVDIQGAHHNSEEEAIKATRKYELNAFLTREFGMQHYQGIEDIVRVLLDHRPLVIEMLS